MREDKYPREKQTELSEVATEQFAYLFWRQYQYTHKKKKKQIKNKRAN